MSCVQCLVSSVSSVPMCLVSSVSCVQCVLCPVCLVSSVSCVQCVYFCFSYVSVSVDHNGELPCAGTFLLHQGIQRRLVVTIVHESGPDLIWRDVKELVVGRIRTTPEWKEVDGANTVLSLNLLPAHYIKQPGDDRSVSHHDRSMSHHDRSVSHHDRSISCHNRSMSRHDRSMSCHDRLMLRHDRSMPPHDRLVSPHNSQCHLMTITS